MLYFGAQPTLNFFINVNLLKSGRANRSSSSVGWFSDIALFGTVLALWLESSLLMSAIMLYSLPVEILWNVDFFIYLFTGYPIVGIAYYMFEEKYSLFLRFLSLFHIIMPLIWMYYIFKIGYDACALSYAIMLCWVTLILTYIFTDPQANINGVFYPEVYAWKISFKKVAVPTVALREGWLLFLLVIFPIIYWFLHIFLFFTNQKFA